MIRLVLRVCVLMAAVQGAWGELAFESNSIAATLPPGDKRFAFEFSFENTGEAPVEITNVKSTCGCTTATPEKLKYKPGEKGALKGHFNVGTRVGKQHVGIVVKTKSAAGELEPENLTLQLDIPQLLQSSPSMLLWQVGTDATEKAINVTFLAEYGIALESVKIDSELFAVRLEDGKDPSEKKIMIKPTSTAAKAQGKVEAEVVINGKAKAKYYFYALVR